MPAIPYQQRKLFALAVSVLKDHLLAFSLTLSIPSSVTFCELVIFLNSLLHHTTSKSRSTLQQQFNMSGQGRYNGFFGSSGSPYTP